MDKDLAEKVESILSEIRELDGQAVQSYVKAGMLWDALKTSKAYRPVSWSEWLKGHGYAVSTVNLSRRCASLILTGGVDPQTLTCTPSRLQEIVRLRLKDKDKAVELVHSANTLPLIGWQDTIRAIKGDKTTDTCGHEGEQENWLRCKACGKFHKGQ